MNRLYKAIRISIAVGLIISIWGILPTTTAQDKVLLRWTADYEGVLRDAIFSPDGETLLTWADWQDEENPTRLWRLEDGSLLWTNVSLINGAQWSNDSTQILIWGVAKTEVWDRTTGMVKLAIETDKRLVEAFWSPDESLICTLSFDGKFSQIQVWEVYNGAEIFSIEFDSLIKSIYWHPDSQHILVSRGPDPYAIEVWDTSSGYVWQAIHYTEFLYDVRWNADATQIIGRTETGTILGWFGYDSILDINIENSLSIEHFYWNPEGTQALIAFREEGLPSIILWNLAEETPHIEIYAIPTHNKPLWRSTGPVWIMSNADIFSFEEYDLLLANLKHDGDLLGATWSRYGMQLVTWTDTNQIYVWDTSVLVAFG